MQGQWAPAARAARLPQGEGSAAVARQSCKEGGERGVQRWGRRKSWLNVAPTLGVRPWRHDRVVASHCCSPEAADEGGNGVCGAVRLVLVHSMPSLREAASHGRLSACKMSLSTGLRRRHLLGAGRQDVTGLLGLALEA